MLDVGEFSELESLILLVCGKIKKKKWKKLKINKNVYKLVFYNLCWKFKGGKVCFIVKDVFMSKSVK